jgi:four helix bundle protein
MITSYEDMEVYKQAYVTSLAIHRITLEFPKFEQHELGGQLRRATKSIALNIAEGYGKKASVAEFKRYLTMALGSNDETIVMLKDGHDLNYMREADYAGFYNRYVSIGKMLAKVIKVWK